MATLVATMALALCAFEFGWLNFGAVGDRLRKKRRA